MSGPASPASRRQRMPNLTRFSKYALVVLVVLLTVALWRPSEPPPTISEYISHSEDDIKVQGKLHHSEHHNSAEDKEGEGNGSTQLAAGLDSKDGPSSSESLAAPNTKLPSSSSPSFPKFGKITATFGEPDPPYENAIASHKLHNEIHGYPHFILREKMLRGLWSKHAYIMTIIGNELAKPKDERLAWVLWHDRDTVLMNPQLPLNIFVPPSPAFDHIHMLVTNDRNGLNNGVFLCRVSAASFKFFASALSIREYQPEIQLKYTEQSGMEEVIKRENWNNIIAYVPQRWFNGFPPTKKDLAAGKPSASRPGSLLIHFASNRDGKRPERMAHWSAIAKKRTAAWDKPVEKTGYIKEITEYWDRLGKGESQQNIIEDIEGRVWNL